MIREVKKLRIQGERYKKQRNWLFVLVLGLMVGLVGWILYSGQQLEQVSHKTQQQINYANSQVTKEQRNENQIKQQAKLEVETAKNNNTNSDTENNQKLNKLTKEVFKTFYTFTPKSYVNRGKSLKGELSDKLLDRMFPSDIKNYHGTITANLLTLQVFPKVVQGSKDKSAVVIVKYESKYSNDGAMKSHQHLFKIHYDEKTNQIDEITDLGDLQQRSQGF